MHAGTIGAAIVAIGLLANTALAAETQAAPSICDVIGKLLGEHTTGFKTLRGNHANTRLGDIWKAKYNVVGNDCEIWRSGTKANMHYVCTRSAPGKAVADDYYQQARDTVRGCQLSGWTETELPRPGNAGVKTRFSATDGNVAIEIHEAKVSGVFKDQWTIYYILGEPLEKLQ